MEARAAGTTVRARVLSLLLGFFGFVALFLVAVGLYATVAYAVTQRTRELGLRASLGAGRTSLAALVARQGVGVTVVGVGVGVVASWWSTRFLRDLVFGLDGVDAPGVIGVCVLLVGVALVATWLPARRGMRIDPMVALRRE
jgi:ABC-type antimicrobial peptide transport system permease subunit